MDIEKLLSTHKLFRNVESRSLKNLRNQIKIETYKRKSTIFIEGDKADCFYIVASGKVRIFKTNSDGRELSIIILGENDFFGEIGIFSGMRTNCADVIEDLSLITINKTLFNSLIEDPQFLTFTNEILRVISKWIVRANKQMLSLATKDFNSESNIAFALNDLAVRTTEKNISQLFSEKSGEIVLKPDINQRDLSLLAGLSAVKFNKNLKNMESKNILSLEKSKGRVVGYKIRNRNAFSDLLL